MRYRWFHVFILFVALLLGPQTVYGQQYQASLSHYSTANGLASNAVAYIAQDGYGYIWLSTWNGISRFDGYHFYNYQTGAASGIPFLHNRVIDMAIDNQQNVWVRMYDGRVFAIKRTIDKIINPFEGIPGYENFKTNYPITIISSGNVLVNVNGEGLYKLRIEADRVNSQLISTNDLVVTSVAEGYQNDIWLGTDKGVHRMDISNLSVERKGLFLDEHVTCMFSNGYNIYVGTESGKILSFSYGQEPKTIYTAKYAINRLFVDSYSIVWFSDQREGVSCIKPNSTEETHFVQHIVVPDYDGHGAVFNEVNNTVWMRMNHGGYGYYNRETDEVEYFHNDPVNPWNLSNTVNSSLELSEGVIWESTSRKGLEKLEILKKTIDRIQPYPNEGPSLNNEIRAMVYDPRRMQYVYASKNGTIFMQRHEEPMRTVAKDDLGHPFGRIYSIDIDRKGNYWLSSKDNGIYLMSQQSGGYSFVNYRHNDDEWSLSDNHAYKTVEDKDGNVWVATFGGGVNVMTKNSHGQTVFLNSKNSMRSFPYNSYTKVRTFAIDKDGNVWAGTTDGILIMSYHDKKLSIQPLKSSERDHDHILMSNDVVCLALDRQGSMWVGTNGGGLAHTIGKDADGCWLFENFGSEDGLPSEEIRAITFDGRGNVWFSTDHVLCSYDTSKRIFTSFSNLDGVDETECSEGAAVCLPNGNVCFGTVNGYYLVDRSKLVTATGNMLKLRITDFFINDELQSPRLNDTFDYYVPDSRSVTLPRHDQVIAFRFASLNYRFQHRVHYQYMLEGYDEGWQNADKLRTATYANLPTGTYMFKVKAFLLESPDRFDMRQIKVVVPPYFLLSSGVIWIYMLLFIVMCIWFMFWVQHRRERAERLRLLREGPRQNQHQQLNDEFSLFLNDYMEIHYSDPMLTIEELQTASDLTEDAFVQQMHNSTGMKPREYVTDYRLRKAVDLLENTQDSIADIAFHCGFANPGLFTRIFQEKTGISPLKYRDMHKTDTPQE